MRDLSLETIIVALTYIDAHDRDIWLKVGNALKTEFGEAAFAVFDNWSQTADNYDAKAVKSVWRSFTIGKVTLGTVRYLAEQNGFDFKQHDSKPIDPQEQAARHAKREQAEREAIAHEQAEKVAWAKLLPLIGQAANTAFSTPFTHAKGVSTTQTTSINSNELHAFKHPFNQHNGKPESIGFALKGLVTLVPYFDLKTGELVKLQGISGIKATEGKDTGKYIKRFIGKGEGYYWRGEILKQDAPKVIVEGFSDAQTVYEYTNHLYASLAAGNDTALMKAAKALRALCPSAVIVVFGDNDLSNKGQRLAEAASIAVNGIFLLPPSRYKDVNEWVLAEGAEGLNKMIDEAIEKTVTERSRSKKAAPSSTEDAAPKTQPSKPIIDDDLHGGDPIPLRKTLSDVMPFTEDLLPPTLSRFVFDEADRMPAAPSFVGTSLITALGSVIGAGCGIKPKQKDDWLIVTNMWGGIVANPTQKKTPAIDSGMRILSCIITEAITDYEAKLKQYKKDVLSYDTDLDSLKSELKSSVNPNAKKPSKHTKEELVDLICKMEEEAPCPPMLRRYKTNDSTVPKLGELEQANPNGILVLRDELIGLLSSLDREGNEGDRAFYLEGFNGTGSYDTDRIGRGHIFIPNHCLSVFGGIQPDKLIAYLEQAYSGLGNDGLLQRFQLLVYPDPIEWQYRDRYPNNEAFKAVLEIFSRLSESDFVEFGAYPTDEYNKRPYFRFTLDAQEFYVNWTYQLNAQKIPNEENTIIQQHLGKYDRLLPALALIFHLVDCVSNHTQGQVGLESIKRAALWCEYLETHARRIYGLLLDGGMKSAIALSSKILKIVKSANRPTAKTDETSEDWLNNGFVLRDIRRKQWQHLTDDTAIQKALVILEDNYWIVSKMQTSTEKGGRPTTRYFISQKLKTSIHPTAKTDETQKTNNSDSFFEQKTGFGSFGSTSPDIFQNLKNNDVNSSLDEVFVNSANSTKWEVDL